MNLLKKEYWWLWLILTILTGGASMIFLAAMLGVLDKKAWYANSKNWIIATVCLVFPVLIMFTVFMIECTCLVAGKLKVSGYEIYLSPYIWLLCLIVPVIGWAFFAIMYLYLIIRILIELYNGKSDKIINC